MRSLDAIHHDFLQTDYLEILMKINDHKHIRHDREKLL